MAKKPNIITLNGKQYDALTGRLLLSGQATNSRAGSIDGMTKVNAIPVLTQTNIATNVLKPAETKVTRPVMDITRPAASKLKHHAPKKSQTLMRSVVKKPNPGLKRHVKTISHSDALVKQPEVTLVAKLSHPTVDQKRANRAKLIPRSNHVRRYALSAENGRLATPRPTTSATTTPKTNATLTTGLKPVYASAPAIAASPVQNPSARSLDVFEKALQRANSHNEHMTDLRKKYPKKRTPGVAKRLMAASGVGLSVLLLTGFLAYQNQAVLTMKYASSQAGFSASLPGYKPAGYKPGSFSYSNGVVGVSYSNNASGQSFDLVQKQTSWDSAALLDDFEAGESGSYKTIRSSGQTIYTYGNNNATWVDSGIWYQVTSEGNLTTNELVDLAASI